MSGVLPGYGRSWYLQPSVSVDFSRDPVERRRREEAQLKQQAMAQLAPLLAGRARTATTGGQPGQLAGALVPGEDPEAAAMLPRTTGLPGSRFEWTSEPTRGELLTAIAGMRDSPVKNALLDEVLKLRLPTDVERPQEVTEGLGRARGAEERERRTAELTRARIGAGIPAEEALSSAQAQERYAEAGGRPGREFEPDVAGARERRFETILQGRGVDTTTAAGAAEAMRLGRELGYGDVAEKIARQGGLRKELETGATRERLEAQLPGVRQRVATVLNDPTVPPEAKAALEVAMGQAESALTPAGLQSVQRQLQGIAQLKARIREFDVRQRALEQRATAALRSRDLAGVQGTIRTISTEMRALRDRLLDPGLDAVERGLIQAQLRRLDELLGPLTERLQRDTMEPGRTGEPVPPPPAAPAAPGGPDPLDKYFKPRKGATSGVRG